MHFKAPIVRQRPKRVLLKQQVADFPPQPVITKHNVTMRIDTVVFFQITDLSCLQLRGKSDNGDREIALQRR